VKSLRSSMLIQSFLLMVFVVPSCFAQESEFDKDLKKGTEELQRQNYKGAEKHLRAAIKVQPASWQAHVSLGDALFGQTKLDCILEYQKAQELAASASAKPVDLRHLNDQLGILYGMSGNFQRSIDTYHDAIAKDQDYPLYYYNLACSFAEKGDLDSALANLREAFNRKDKWPDGRSMPDPHKDSSFKNYVGNQNFEKAMKEMGF
jgi:tetratricopeptide (TPR) repeat protein